MMKGLGDTSPKGRTQQRLYAPPNFFGEHKNCNCSVNNSTYINILHTEMLLYQREHHVTIFLLVYWLVKCKILSLQSDTETICFALKMKNFQEIYMNGLILWGMCKRGKISKKISITFGKCVHVFQCTRCTTKYYMKQYCNVSTCTAQMAI